MEMEVLIENNQNFNNIEVEQSEKIESKDVEDSHVENDADMEEDRNSLAVNRKKRRRLVLSDSEDDEKDREVSTNVTSDFPIETNKFTVFEAESTNVENEELVEVPTKKPSKRIQAVSSDSDLSDHEDSTKDLKQSIEFKSAPDSRLSLLCDPDSEEECETTVQTYEKSTVVQPPPKSRSKKVTKNNSISKPTTAKEAAEQRQEIQSESQRMLREKNVSLPYHKPKSRGIKEFLARRPKLASVVPVVGQTPPSLAIKMTKEQLEIITKKQKERELELKEFYKSDSESDNEIDDPDFEIKPNDELTTSLVGGEIVDIEPPKEIESAQPSVDCATNYSKNNNELIEEEAKGANDPSEEIIDNVPTELEKSDDYDFNLDDMETSDNQISSIDADSENLNSKESPAQVLNSRKSVIELVKEKMGNDQPKLSGHPNDVIDLDTGLSRPKEVVQLMERFAKHVNAKKHHHPHHKVKLSIVTVESDGDIHKEEVAVNVDSDDDTVGVEEKPGAKLHRLKEELQQQMVQKKSEIWQQKSKHGLKTASEVTEIETVDKDILDNEDEEEFTDEEEYMDEEMEEDMYFTEKPRKKSEFLDQEAEVSDDEIEHDKAAIPEEELAESDEAGKKELKRIIKPSDSDSEEEEMFNTKTPVQVVIPAELDSTVTGDEDEIPPYQPRPLVTPVRAPSQTKSITDFLTPISFLTSIQNLGSASKTDMSPVLEHSLVQKKLFSDDYQPDSFVTQQSEELTQQDTSETRNVEDEPPSTQDLMGICSGAFTGVTQLSPPSNEMKSLDGEDMIISQLLDEDEMESFKKKFESPSKSQNLETDEIVGGGIIDSDDDDDEIVKQSNKRRVILSDDSDTDNDDVEEIDLQDKDEIDQDNIGYDSEENEIDVRQEKMKIADFVEAEAELSESEWGSEDEDEKGLDQLEFELGDTDNIDQDQVRLDIEKIDMRRMLADDQREVKLLQELLLEDGELHGTGRQRQFKWKNIDSNMEQLEENKDDNDIYLDEEESEEQWRKKRHEREMFLKKHQTSSEDLLGGSQLLKLGEKILQRSVSSISQSTTLSEETSNIDESPFNKTLFTLQNKRGSFLNRSDKVLSRVVEYTKVVEEIDSSRKTTKHFVFQTTSSVKDSTVASSNIKKRKALEGTPNVLKKLRLSTNFSPAVKKDQPKSDRVKQLFSK